MSRRSGVIGWVSVAALGLSLLASPSSAAPVTSPASGGAAAAASATPGAPGAGDPYFPLYGNGGYDVRHYSLDVRYDPATDVLRGRATLRVRATQDLSRFNLDLVGLTVRSVGVDGRHASWVRNSNHELVITPNRAIRKGRTFEVVVRYDGKPELFSSPLIGTYGFLTTPDGALAVGQPEVAAFWYPVNDHPEDKATYQIRLTVPQDLQALSNGLPEPTTTQGRWATTTWRVQHPMASYLAFMAVGHFDVHRWQAPNGLPIIDAVDSGITGPLRANIEAALAHQDEILAAASEWFGPYPFEAAGGVVDRLELGFALENQTRPTYSTAFWGNDRESFENDGVVVHELAHQWYGDSVALDRWRDVWLNEGFATYAEWLWLDREGEITPAEILDILYAGIPADDPFWKVRPGDPGPDTLFDGAVYTRGALTLQVLREQVGDDDFFQILQDWARQRRDRNGTTTQFIALAESVSGQQLDTLFDEWLFQGDKPPAPAADAVDQARGAGAPKDLQRDLSRLWRPAGPSPRY
jgi:aminopeptidase N